MADKRTNVIQLALDLRRGIWLIKDPDIFMPVVNSFFNRQQFALEPLPDLNLTSFKMSADGDSVQASGEEDLARRVMVIPVHGGMTKYETCENYGTSQVAARIQKYLSDPSVVGFVIDIDSPGGASNAVYPLVEAIRKIKASGKPVIAHCDACYSAAYWVASQCDAVFADNELSGFGSIGAYAQFLDDREDKQTGFKVVTVYAPESKDKNIAYREALDGKPEKMQELLSKLVQSFHTAVKAGRPALKVDADGVLSGADFQADEAIKVGLADGMATLEQCIENVFVRAEFNS
jgi:protease-4